ncbi:MAG: hypothetical protein ACLFT3_13915 [Cyclobacteriaceae bacterium]
MIRLHGDNYTRNYLEHETMLQGRTLELDMSSQPDQVRGTNTMDFPFSMSQPEESRK